MTSIQFDCLRQLSGYWLSHMIILILYYCITVLLYYCITVLLYYCYTVLLYYCITVLLYYCITVLLYYCITVLLLYCITVLLYYCITVLLLYCITVLLYYCYCITVLLLYCITVLLYYCTIFRSEYSAFWRCVQAACTYLVTQLCKVCIYFIKLWNIFAEKHCTEWVNNDAQNSSPMFQKNIVHSLCRSRSIWNIFINPFPPRKVWHLIDRIK